MRGMFGELLGCDWGHRIAAAGYVQVPCHARAVQIVILHDGLGGQREVKLCGPHRDFVLLETNPHAAAGGMR